MTRPDKRVLAGARLGHYKKTELLKTTAVKVSLRSIDVFFVLSLAQAVYEVITRGHLRKAEASSGRRSEPFYQPGTSGRKKPHVQYRSAETTEST